MNSSKGDHRCNIPNRSPALINSVFSTYTHLWLEALWFAFSQYYAVRYCAEIIIKTPGGEWVYESFIVRDRVLRGAVCLQGERNATVYSRLVGRRQSDWSQWEQSLFFPQTLVWVACKLFQSSLSEHTPLKKNLLHSWSKHSTFNTQEAQSCGWVRPSPFKTCPLFTHTCTHTPYYVVPRCESSYRGP